MLRSSLCILYAHWEGYIRKAATAYIDFVARKKLKYSELSTNFVGLALRKTLKEVGKSNKAKDHQVVVNLFLRDFTTEVVLSSEDAVDTQSNLTSKVLENIMDALGLNQAKYVTKSLLIDSLLVAKRNSIAHGELVPINLDDYEQLHNEVLALVEAFKTDVENAASVRSYLY